MDKDGWGWLLLIYVLKKFIMEFTLNFNEMECKRFLIKEGYTIERYHGIVEDEFFHTLEGFTIILAYKERKDWSKY
jgi:hypothetical protein